MDKPFYEFQVFDDAFRFEFKSISSEKILATVIQTILAFLAFYPTKKVVFTGSTPS